MSQSCRIDEPQVLFTLPQPLDINSGKIRAGSVYACNKSRKKRRCEIITAVDGECVNIYNVKNPKSVASYAIPPQTYLTCEPTCVLHRSRDRHQPERYTYAGVRQDLNNNKCRIICFYEKASGSPNSTTGPESNSTKWTYDIPDHLGPVLYTDILALKDDGESFAGHGVLAIFKSGAITLLSPDLKRTLWFVENPNLFTEGREDSQIKYAILQDIVTAKQGILKGRPDLTASLDIHAHTTQASASNQQILSVVTGPIGKQNTPGRDRVHVLAISGLRQESQLLHELPARLLVQWHLPRANDSKDRQAMSTHYQIDNSSNTLYQWDELEINIYDFSGVKPQIKSALHPSLDIIQDVQPLSRNTALVTSPVSHFLFDTSYGSVQASCQTQISDVKMSGQKRKRSNSSDPQALIQESLKITQWYPKLQLAIGLKGRQIMALQVSMPAKWRKKSQQSLLIDSLGRVPLITHLDNSADMENFRSLKATFSILAQEDKTEKYDRLFFDSIKENQHILSLAGSQERLVGLLALGTLFDWNTQPSGRSQNSFLIKIICSPKETLKWLIEHGFLTPQNVTNGLLLAQTSNQGATSDITTADIVAALAELDSGLSHIVTLTSSTKMAVDGWIESLKYLLRSFDSQSPGDNHKSLAQTQITEADGTEESFEAEVDAAQRDLQLATAMHKGGLEMRANSLKTCLERLGTCFPSSQLTKAMRQQLSQRDRWLMIQILRMELGQSGWTSHKLNLYSMKDNGSYGQEGAILVICTLLSCTIDALGSGGWLAEQEYFEDEAGNTSADVVSSLRNDISATLQCAQESSFFHGFLKDFLRYAQAYDELPYRRWEEDRSNRLRRGYSLLPLGTKSAKGISTTYVAFNGTVKQLDKRGIAAQLNKTVGKYEFDKIRV